jgi:hypothetical protein
LVYFQDTCADVIWDETAKVVIVEWKKFATLEKIQLVLNKSLELLHQKKASKYLGNSSNMAPFSKEAGTWIGEDWTPRAIAGGMKYLAYLVPKSAMTRLTIQNIKSEPLTNYETAYFDNMEAAKAWLASR